jgi:hypothetical protein
MFTTVGLRSEKGCVGDARQNWSVQTRLLVREGAPHQQTRNCLKNNQRENGKNWPWVPDGCLTPGRTGRLTVGRNITLTLTLTLNVSTGRKRNPVPGSITGQPCSWGISLRDLALQVGGVSYETVKYGREFCGTWIQQWLLWQGPEAIVWVNYRPILSSERAPHINKPAIFWYQDRPADWPSGEN